MSNFRWLAALMLPIVLSGAAVAGGPDNARALERLSAQFVARHRPDAIGDAQIDYSAGSFLARIEGQQAELRQLLAIGREGLSLQQDIDRRLLIGMARADIRVAETQRVWENDPALYLPSEQLGMQLAALPDAPNLSHRQEALEALSSLLVTVPGRLQQGRENLRRPSQRFTEGAIFQVRSTLAALAEVRAELPAMDAAANAAFAGAEQAMVDYLAFLEEDLLPRSDGSWALGEEVYEYVLRERWHLDADGDQLLARGRQAFADTEALAQQVAARIEPGKHWAEVYESLKDDHPPADGIKQAYQQQMDRAQAFVREHGIVTLPGGERVITIDTPPALRRSSPFGTFETASPFDGDLEGRLVLTPIEDWMTPEQQAARLRSHHRAWIPVIAVHEAYPGHHAQALIVTRNPNLLRRVIRESIFSEGWGLYTEELMFEQGFLQGDDVRLTQLRNRLWRAARVILDVSLHTRGMSFDEAVAFLVEKVRFEPYAAELEVGMYIRNPTYVLGYLIGMQEIEAIRADWVARYGRPDPPSEFYDRLLEIGAIPPALLREELFAVP
jgi:uncharacterized protein (DUF885 family)